MYQEHQYFEKTENKKTVYDIELVQIRYLKDIPQFNVKSGQLGGWISKETILSNDGKWFLSENVNVFGGTIECGTIECVFIFGGTIRGGTIRGGTIEGGTIEGGTIEGGTIRGGTIRGGTIRGGTIEGGTIRGGTIRGGTIRGGTIEGGTIPVDFGQVPYIVGGKYPINFSGYSESGERLFACGCKVFPESKWTSAFRKKLAITQGFSDSELKLSNELFSVIKKITPKMEGK